MSPNSQVLSMTQAACPVCRAIVPAKVVSDGRDVYLQRFCAAHGESRSFVRANVGDYLQTLRYVKPASLPEAFFGDAGAPCPEGCGMCERHEQHLCMPIVEITSRCNLACPVCINSSGGGGVRADLTPRQFAGILDRILTAERQIDVLNLSGGEPLLHPQLLEIVDEALARHEIVRVSLSTNGLLLLQRPALVDELARRNVVVSLQFDGFDDGAYSLLRGRPLLQDKLRILERLGEAGITTTLTMTVAGGVNERQIPAMLDCLFSTAYVVSLMLQPVAFAGRAAAMAGGLRRLTIPDVIALLSGAGNPNVHSANFVPLPCSHPLCFSLAFYLMLDGGRAVSVSQLTDAATLMDSLANRIFFGLAEGEEQRLKELIYELWSGPAGAVPESQAVLATLRGLLRDISANCGNSACTGFDPRRVFTRMERKVKSIFIHAFQDAETFDLARVRRCCQAYPQADGTLLPACVHNVLRRPGAAKGG